jgi:hypothetical protein
MPDSLHDLAILRNLAQRYAEAAAKPIQQERRQLWKCCNSLRPTRPLVVVTYGMWNVWCREEFGEHKLQCRDPFLREHERALRLKLFHDGIGDDFILEPWHTLLAVTAGARGAYWGVKESFHKPDDAGAGVFDPPIKQWSDMVRLTPPPHRIDEGETARRRERLQQAFGDILPIDVQRGPVCQGFIGDISTTLARLRGLEQIMLDMYDAPGELHRLLAFMRDGVLANQQSAEDAGDWCATDQRNQAQCYSDTTLDPAPNVRAVKRKHLFAHVAAQEFALISPSMHEEFLLRYQLPIMQKFGLVTYGCCEDLTQKIAMLRNVPNLRIIAVAPRADLKACAAQIALDYVISWRPNPTDVISYGFDEDRIRRILREGLAVTRGQHVQVHLKDVETVEGEPQRLARFAQIAREEIDKVA